MVPAMTAAGVTAPPAPSPSELGWTGSLPHPTQYAAAADAELLKQQSKEVRGVAWLAGCASPKYACSTKQFNVGLVA